MVDRNKQAKLGGTSNTLAVRLPDNLDAHLREYAAAEGVSLNAAVLLAVAQLSRTAEGKALGAYLAARERPLPEPLNWDTVLSGSLTPLEQAGGMIVEYGRHEARQRVKEAVEGLANDDAIDVAQIDYWQEVLKALPS